jgi:hypothetical protein
VQGRRGRVFIFLCFFHNFSDVFCRHLGLVIGWGLKWWWQLWPFFCGGERQGFFMAGEGFRVRALVGRLTAVPGERQYLYIHFPPDY